jgi:membrane protein required for colicin V production
MNYLDIAIICILAWYIFSGIRKGFIISLASLVALAVGIYAAIHFAYFLDGIIAKTFNISAAWLPVASFIAMFLLVLIGVMLIGKALEKVVDLVGMDLLNHLAGGLFGLLKGFLIVSILLYILNIADPHSRMIKGEVKEKSLFYSAVQPLFPRLKSW